jgi:hypothetical protein
VGLYRLWLLPITPPHGRQCWLRQHGAKRTLLHQHLQGGHFNNGTSRASHIHNQKINE